MTTEAPRTYSMSRLIELALPTPKAAGEILEVRLTPVALRPLKLKFIAHQSDTCLQWEPLP